ncbi:putative metalloprotease CJM1_0395 family protein [Coralliovum pocilloporae]|uniref:putative metalloprotease CJM1_0395 family protein n=1 Tax=Coralliovum pocilloporae TaxID=3066369 RepID=UPI003307B85F
MIDRLGAAVPVFQRADPPDVLRGGRTGERENNNLDTSSAAVRPQGNATASLTANALRSPSQSAANGSATDSPKKSKNESGPNDLSEEEEQQVRKLKDRDAEVRAHEQAHATVGGEFAGPPTYTEVTGPDGKRYAIGGEVSIDAAPVAGDPEETIRKLDVVIRAALAPAEPSSQDLAVARQAQQGLAQARAELQERRINGGDEDSSEPSQTALPGPLSLQEETEERDRFAASQIQQAIQAYQTATAATGF